MSLSPQPALDVQESVGDVEPGVEEGDVVTAGGLQQGEFITYINTESLKYSNYVSLTFYNQCTNE